MSYSDAAIRDWLGYLEDPDGWTKARDRDRRRGRVRPPPPGDAFGFGWLPGEGYPPAQSGDHAYIRDAGTLDFNSVVAVCLAWISDQIPQAVLQVGRRIKKGERKGTWQPNLSHALNAVFRQPCPVYSARQTWGAVAADFKVDGNSYLVKLRDNGGRTTGLWWVPNELVEVHPSSDPRRPVAVYRVRGHSAGTEVIDYDPADILHIKDRPDPRNPILGISRLKAQLRSIAALQNADATTANVLRNVQSRGFLTPRQQGETTWSAPDENDMRRAQSEIERGGSGINAGRLPATSIPIDFVNTSMTPTDMELGTLPDRPEAMICAAMGLNSLVLGLPSSSATRTYSNLGEARRHAWEDGIVPMQDVIAEALRDGLLYETDPDTGEQSAEFAGDGLDMEVWWDRSEVAALNEDLESRTNRAVAGWEGDLLRKNEARSLIDQPAVEDGSGDQFKSEIGMERAKEIAAGQQQGGDEDEDEDLDGFDEEDEDEEDDEKEEKAPSRNGFAVATKAEWQERQHPRAGDGKFAARPGGKTSARQSLVLPYRTGAVGHNVRISVKAAQSLGIDADGNGYRPIADYAGEWAAGNIPAAFDYRINKLWINGRSDVWDDPAELAQERHEDGFWSSPDAEHTLRHEIAHALHFRAVGKDDFVGQSRDGGGKLTPEEDGIAYRKVSRYATQTPNEFVAEVYAGMLSGRRFDPDVMAVYRKYHGPELP